MLEKLAEQDFYKVYNLMRASFPRDEFRNYEGQKALLEIPEYQIYIWPDAKRPEPKAFIAVWEFESFVFVEHFAVDPDCRNEGLGAKILAELSERTEQRICLEVELPETELAKRRIAFYERNQFFFNDYTYEQPPIFAGCDPLPLRIMTTEKQVNADEFQKIKQELYERVYRL